MSGETVAVSTASNIICCSRFLVSKSSSTPISAIAIIKLNLAESKNPPPSIFRTEIFENIRRSEGRTLTRTAIPNKYSTST